MYRALDESKFGDREACHVMCRQREGHDGNSVVRVINSDKSTNLFVSGDSLGGVALWKYREHSGVSCLGVLKGKSLGGVAVTAIEICCGSKYIVIGTTQSLILIGEAYSLYIFFLNRQ